jgi:hypothetical protein
MCLGSSANAHVKERSFLLRRRFDQGLEQERKKKQARPRARVSEGTKKKQEALLAAVQEGLPARWVGDEVAQAEQRAGEGSTLEVRRRAGALVKKIDKARKAVGKGNTEHRTPEGKIESKRRAASKSRVLRRLLEQYKAWGRRYIGAEKVAEIMAEGFRRKGHIQDDGRREEIIAEFLKRVREHRARFRICQPFLKHRSLSCGIRVPLCHTKISSRPNS